MSYVIVEPCIGEKAGECVDVCPVDCIHEGEDQYFIDPDVCISCGACESVCPVAAIEEEYDLKEGNEIYLEKAIQFFKNRS